MKKLPPKFIWENENWDKKSLIFFWKNPEWSDLIEDIVWFANNRGGHIYFWIEDDADLPSAEQKITDIWLDEWSQKIRKKVSGNTENVNPVVCTRETAENGWQYLKITIYPTTSTIACTSKWIYTIRFEDETKRLKPTELQHILSEKWAYIWESRKTAFRFADANPVSYKNLIDIIRANERVDEFIKQKTDREICEYYKLTESDYLTNLGVLWIGTMTMRAKIAYPIRISIIYLDADGQVMRPQKDYTDLTQSPQSLLESVMSLDIWQEWIEVSDGVYREFVEFYPKEAVKEIVANAICHRSYTLDGDIFINIYANTKLEIVSPGSLPLGVTPQNILHKSIPRNQQFAELAKATKMMEKLGSGYDKIYERLLSRWKNIPLVESGDDSVRVTIDRKISDPWIINLINEVSKKYKPNQRQLIVLWLIAQHSWLTTIDLARYLDISTKETKDWIGNLIETAILISRGETRWTIYIINPKLLKQLNHTIKTTLKYIEPHRLEALLLSDLDKYGTSWIIDIQKRIWPEIPRHTIRRMLEKLIWKNQIQTIWNKRWKQYMSFKK